ncbi:MAG: Fe-S protein assembly chaperone HscA [Proteobacteria bacterium]|nr:Fe-S protein assembly chaperone HscA [Pseudomonadales bacterium]MDA0805320.1 Fe-S protein assembly chaperone HscA [Pseudomonadota bacterium]MDA0896429.1 Fe-S protein assembly chaperone HscA [Pseudomonadota bacterium]MDA1245049.1 Fe-S protein assembly chaperone HscA [Pseudomonadota bacterium]
MALLQIQEPGGKPARPKHRLAVGIDLGTTNSLVAARCGLKVETLPDESGEHLLPSIVHYGSDGLISVGRKAKAFALTDPKNTLVSVKRMLGKGLTELRQLGHYLPYEFDATREDTAPAVLTHAGSKDPVAVSSDILSVLKARAERALKGELEGAVITVPAYFNDAQRQQTKEAAELAGINVLRLLNEPTAAAVAYGLDSADQGNIVVFDLGGGTFDVSLLSLTRGVFEVLSTGGDTNLGGDDFDRLLAAWLISQSGESAVVEGEALQLANELKHQLSDVEEVEFTMGDYQGSLSREQFAEIAKEPLSRAMMICRRSLRDARLGLDEIDNVVLVGGSTRMPLVRAAVAEFFGREPLTSIDPDKVVAVGAGIQADVLIGNKSDSDFLLLDVTPLSLGIETMGELVEKIIPRNTTIPVSRAQEFTTFKDGQTAMALHVLQGEREAVADCRSLARFTLRGIPSMVAGAAKIRVTFQVDADGLLSVSAEETFTGVKSEIQVKPSYGLEAETIESILQASQENARADMELRSLQEAKVDAMQLIDAVAAAVIADPQLLEEGEEQRINEGVAALAAALENGSSAEVSDLTAALNRISGDFAARRMDVHISRALQGESI